MYSLSLFIEKWLSAYLSLEVTGWKKHTALILSHEFSIQEFWPRFGLVVCKFFVLDLQQKVNWDANFLWPFFSSIPPQLKCKWRHKWFIFQTESMIYIHKKSMIIMSIFKTWTYVFQSDSFKNEVDNCIFHMFWASQYIGEKHKARKHFEVM